MPWSSKRFQSGAFFPASWSDKKKKNEPEDLVLTNGVVIFNTKDPHELEEKPGGSRGGEGGGERRGRMCFTNRVLFTSTAWKTASWPLSAR